MQKHKYNISQQTTNVEIYFFFFESDQ